MRRFDKIKNIKNVNLLAEQRHLESKGLIKEEESSNNNHDRNAMINILARYGRNREGLENLSYEKLFLGLKDIATSKYLDDPLVKQLYNMLKPKKKGFFKEGVVDEEKVDEMAGRNLKDIIVNVPDEFSLSLIKRTPALANNFWPKDLERFEVGDNKITVNHFIYGRLKNSYPEFGKPFGVRDAESIDDTNNI
jgi:hypothetical protein